MNHRDNKDKNLSKDTKKPIHSSQISNEAEHNQSKLEQSIATNHHRSCLKHRPHQSSENHDKSCRSSSGRVSFAHSTLNDGKILLTSQSQTDFGEKKRRSDMFVKKAKAFQLDELAYFKNHARDKEPIDE
jgi:hypothetical protein